MICYDMGIKSIQLHGPGEENGTSHQVRFGPQTDPADCWPACRTDLMWVLNAAWGRPAFHTTHRSAPCGVCVTQSVSGMHTTGCMGLKPAHKLHATYGVSLAQDMQHMTWTSPVNCVQCMYQRTHRWGQGQRMLHEGYGVSLRPTSSTTSHITGPVGCICDTYPAPIHLWDLKGKENSEGCESGGSLIGKAWRGNTLWEIIGRGGQGWQKLALPHPRLALLNTSWARVVQMSALHSYFCSSLCHEEVSGLCNDVASSPCKGHWNGCVFSAFSFCQFQPPWVAPEENLTRYEKCCQRMHSQWCSLRSLLSRWWGKNNITSRHLLDKN